MRIMSGERGLPFAVNQCNSLVDVLLVVWQLIPFFLSSAHDLADSQIRVALSQLAGEGLSKVKVGRSGLLQFALFQFL